MTDVVKVREIRKQLNQLAPYPEDGNVTAAGLARYLAKQAQVTYVTGLDPSAALLDRQAIARMVAEFAAAHALYAFAEADPKRADLAAAQIFDAWEDGGGVGEWLYEYLGEETVAQVSRLTEELSAAQNSVPAS